MPKKQAATPRDKTEKTARGPRLSDADNLVAAARCRLCLTQRDFAKKIGLSLTSICLMEKGKMRLAQRTELLCKLILKDPDLLETL